MLMFTDDSFERSLRNELGVEPSWSAEASPDPNEDVRQSIRHMADSPFITKTSSLRGFVFDVAAGKLNEVLTRLRRNAFRHRPMTVAAGPRGLGVFPDPKGQRHSPSRPGGRRPPRRDPKAFPKC